MYSYFECIIYFLLYVHSTNIFIFKLLVIDPCGEYSPLVFQTDDNGFIDSSVLAIDESAQLSCRWKLKVKRHQSFTIKAHAIKLNERLVSINLRCKSVHKIDL